MRTLVASSILGGDLVVQCLAEVCHRSKNLIRVLVAIKPVLYREAIAGALQKHRPHLEVRTVAPEDLDGEVVRFEPHLVFCHQATAKVRERVPSWVEVAYEDSIDAAASISGESSKIHNIATSNLLSILDSAQERLS